MPDSIVESRKPGRSKERPRRSELEVAMLQPWFIPKQTWKEVLRLLPSGWKRKMRYCFDDYGCIRCDRKNVQHRGCGMCDECFARITRRLKFTVRRHFRELVGAEKTSYAGEFQRRAVLAEKLLEGMSERNPISQRHASPKKLGHQNPARQLSGMSIYRG
jgi:hypothetical protein